MTIVRPVDLKARANGDLPTELLRPVKDAGQLHHLAARAWIAMRAAAQADGVALNPRLLTNAYRPLADQERIFRQRYRSEETAEGRFLRQAGRPHKVWGGVRWYQRPNTAEAAVPGTSNHGWGLAVDVDSVALGGRFRWLDRNADRFGFSWELQSEPWHIRYVRAAKIPAAVLEVEGALGLNSTLVPADEDTIVNPTSEEPDMNPEQARQLELVYNALCGGLERGGVDPGAIDLGGPILTTHHLAHLLAAKQPEAADPQVLAESIVTELGEDLAQTLADALSRTLSDRRGAPQPGG